MFTGDDIKGKKKLIEAFNEAYHNEYFSMDSDMFRHYLAAVSTKNELKTRHLKRIMKLYRRHFNIILVHIHYKKIDVNDPYYQYTLELNENDEESANEVMEIMKSLEIKTLLDFKNIKSFKKCVIIPCTVDYGETTDFPLFSKALKQEIDDIINK